MAKGSLSNAKNKKFDEFYTQYPDIEKEMQAYLEYDPNVFRDKVVLLPCDDPEWSNFTRYFALHFEEFGIKKLISTSFAHESKNFKTDWQPTLFETENPIYNAEKSAVCGKIFTLDRDTNADGRIDIDDLQFDYLDGNGDFRSAEVTSLRDQSDVIITNPPFSLWREFFNWVMDSGKQFIMIGNMNAITYKEVFPEIKNNRVWLGNGFRGGNAYFSTPDNSRQYASGVRQVDGTVKFRNCCWYTNIDHGRRHQPLSLMTMDDNLRFSKHIQIKEDGYLHYDNCNAIEVPYTDSIPSDYKGVMGVPISILEKYCPEQFDIIAFRKGDDGKDLVYTKDGKAVYPYFRILIKHK